MITVVSHDPGRVTISVSSCSATVSTDTAREFLNKLITAIHASEEHTNE